jgi:hypothetical protein
MLQRLEEQPQICDKNGQKNSPLYFDLQDSNEIRLLYLQPKSSGEKITCMIKHVKFDDQSQHRPLYEALSYVWGPPTILKPMLVNENTVNVRENLWLALYHLRLESDIRVLWIDALCINQQNIHERNHQVTQMGMIYHQAKKVIVWLGPPDAESELAFQVLSSLAEWDEFINPSNDPAKTAAGNQKLTAFHSLLTRGYWKRLWIIQEFLMAREVMLQSGGDTCRGFRISWFMQVLADISELSRDRDIGRRAAILHDILDSVPARLIRLRNPPKRPISECRTEPVSEPLFRLFSEYKTAECEDQRDKIFGLHSLANSCCKEAVQVNYSLKWQVTLANLVHHQIYIHPSLPKDIESDPPYSAVKHFRDFYYTTKQFRNEFHPNKTTTRLEALEIFAQKLIHEPKDFGLTYSMGYVRGRVCYTSPPLDQLFSKCCPELPELTSMAKCQIDYICSLHGDPETCHPHANTETDLFGLSHHFVVLTAPHKFPEGLTNFSQYVIDYWGNNVFVTSKSQSDGFALAKNFRNLLRAAQKCPGTDHILAFEENGLIFFAPKNIRVGDLVCQFPESDVLAVLQPETWRPRQSALVFTKIHRVVNFLASPFNMAADICGKPMSFDRAGPYALSFKLNDRERELLCGASEAPNGDHNILKMSLE